MDDVRREGSMSLHAKAMTRTVVAFNPAFGPMHFRNILRV